MAWIESHQDLRSNPKVKRAARRLAISPVQLVGHLHFLWHWALDHADDGDITPFDAEDLADAAGFEDDPEEFVQALIDCGPGEKAGFIERDGIVGDPNDGKRAPLVLHDWWEYAGKLVAKRRRDAERKARARQQDTAEPSEGSPQDVRGTSDGQDAERRADGAGTEPNPTNQPNQPNHKQVDAEFDDFWQRYPRGKAGKPGGDGPRKPALQKWRRMTQAERDAAVAAVDNYREHISRPDSPYAAHAVTWLNQERWEQWQERASPNGRAHEPVTAGGVVG